MLSNAGNTFYSFKRALAATASGLLGLIFVAMNAPQTTAQSQAGPQPSFEVVSIKPVGFEGRVTMAPQPNGLFAEAVTTRTLMRNAYRVQKFQIELKTVFLSRSTFAFEE